MPPENSELSEREFEILNLVATGASNKEIAYKLSISTNTVKVHLRNIFSKIGVNSRTEAAIYAVNAGLIPGAGELSGSEEESASVEYPISNFKNRRLIIFLMVFLIALVGGIVFIIWRVNNPTSVSDSTDTPEWRELATMLTARSGMAVVDYEGFIYAIGGESRQGVTGVVERYDPYNNFWLEVSHKPTPVKDIHAASIGGKIYVPGGLQSTGEPTEILEVYDPQQDTWETASSLPLKLSAYAMVTFEGRLYVFGGWDGQQYLNSVYEYDPRMDIWTTRTPMRVGRGFAGAVLSGERIYILGGFDGQQALAVNEVYQPVLDTANRGQTPWNIAASLPIGRYAAGVANLADIIYVIGGEGASNEDLISLEFHPQSNEWRGLTSKKSPNCSHLELVSIAVRLYAIGGLCNDNQSNQNMVFQVIYTISIPLLPVGEP